jgi:tetratricopeptide (TPR) repeat protein
MREIEFRAAATMNPITATWSWIRQAVRAITRQILFLIANLITICRIQPDNALIVGIVKVMNAPGAQRLRALVPAFSAFIVSPTRAKDSSADRTQHPTLPDQAALAVAAIATFAGSAARAADVLEAHVDSHAPEVAPEVFVRLAETHLGMNSVVKATETLRRGLDIHPESGDLCRAIALALSSNSEWAEALIYWELVPEDLQIAANLWTVIGIARAYRLTGNPHMALDLARRATRANSDNDLLQEEISLCRRLVIDWPHSLVSADPAGTERHTGEVTSLGFLHGGTKPLTGWVDLPEDGEPEVRLVVNHRTMAATAAATTPTSFPRKAFSINCADLQQYLGDGDIVQVVSNGNTIYLPGLGNTAIVDCGETSQFDLLQNRLDEGYVFTKDGRLRPGHDADSKRAVLDFYEEVSNVIEAGTGQPVFPFYGNLLGAVREGDFIKHDVDGFDIIYLCRSNEPGDVRAEIATICRLLLEKGYDLRIEPWSVMIRRNHPDTIFIDMNYAWFTPSDELNVSFGWRFEPALGRARFIANRSCRLADREVTIPGNAEDVLQQLYGSLWRVPDQGFESRKRLERDDSYFLTSSEIRSIRISSQRPESSLRSRS